MKQISLAQEKSDYHSITDAQLLELIGKENQNPSDKQKAFNEFYRRYSDYLWKVCSIVCRTHFQSREISKDVFQQTMVKVFLNSGGYNGNISSIKTWISRIARNEFVNYINKTKSSLTLFDEVRNVDVNDVPYDDAPLEVEVFNPSQVEQALNNLSEKERQVLMTYMMFYDESEKNKHLPERELKELCNYLKTTPENIRQIKLRALKKVKAQLKMTSL